MNTKTRNVTRLVAGVALAGLAVVGTAAVPAGGPADVLVTGGRIWTADPRNPWAEAVAIRGERIVFVGAAPAAASWRGPKTEVVEAKGLLVVPGFNDAHIHLLEGALTLDTVDLIEDQDLAAVQARIRAFAAQNPRNPWVLGRGWLYGSFPGSLPTREQLDAVVSDRPAYMDCYDFHTGWANSKALALAGITRDTKDPEGGTIVRDPGTGEPTGVLKEDARALVKSKIPAPDAEARYRLLLRALALLNGYGITSVQDARTDSFTLSEDAPLLERALREGKLTVRVAAAVQIKPGAVAAAVAEARRLGTSQTSRTGDAMLRFGRAKVYVDGVIEAHTASLLAPYADDPSVGAGAANWTPAALNAAVIAADKAGLQVYLHAIGDRAVRIALDAHEAAARANGPRDRRPRIEHIETIDPADYPRFKTLGVMASMQPLHANPDQNNAQVWSHNLGPERAGRGFSWGNIERAGGRLVFGSDWPVVTPDVFRGLYVAVTRKTREGTPAGGWHPELAVSLENALRHYTIDGAYASFEEKVKGSIEVGKLADLVVLSEDVFRGPPETILKTRALLTLMNGKVVHRDEKATPPPSATGRQVDTNPAEAGLPYPLTAKGSQVDDYHGVKVADPYRWLEDADTPESRAWIEAENALTFGYLERIPRRAAIRERLTKLWNYERFGVPFKQGGRYFYSRNDGLQNQNVLYTVDALEGTPRLLLDPNTLSKDGTVALSGLSVSEDGKYLAYGIAEAGSDWNTWRVREVATGKDTADELRWVKFSDASWTKDGRGFFYSRYDEPKGEALKSVNHFQKIYYHRLGTTQADDTLVYERKDQPEWYLNGAVTDDGRYLVIAVSDGKSVHTALFYKDLAVPGSPVVELLKDFDAQYSFVGNDGAVFWVQSDLEAPRGRVWAIEVKRPARANWKELLPQSAEALQGVGVVGDRFFASYLKDARAVVRVFDLLGRPQKDVELPGIGSVAGFGGKRTDGETFYSFSSYTVPTVIYRYDVNTGESRIFREPRVDFDRAAFETRQAFYSSKDGTRVPLFLTHKKGLSLDGTNPVLLYGYGGFGIPVTPGFSVANAVWLEMGGVYAVANLRGGNEYGEEWHQGGMKLQKQNVFDDFIAAAEWLVANRYTSPRRLAIQGVSNGGLLVGACMTQRPDLFGAALPAVGVMDMLRFHKFTVGWGWVGDYGSAENADEFTALRAYSPYHNLKKGTCYPATLVTTADHDDRVFPAHSFKFAAALQDAQSCDNPTLIRIETRAGHGAGKPTSKRIDEAADAWAFLVKTLGMD